MCAQAGALVGFAGYPVAAAMLVGISSAVWNSSFTARAVPDTPLFFGRREFSLRMMLILTLAIVFTAAGLTRYMESTRRFDGLGVPSQDASRDGFSRWQRHGQVQDTGASMSGVPAADLGEAYLGIVLWPEKRL